MIETILGYFAGMIVGIIMGLFGGGGSLLLPVLLYLLHLDLRIATAYTTFLVGVTAAIGVVGRLRQNLIDVQTVLALGIPVSVGMLLVRLWLYDVVPEELFVIGSVSVTKKMFVLTIFGGLLLLSAATMKGWIGRDFKPQKNLRTERPTTYYATLIGFGLLIGILPGFAGAGGGVLIVPLLVVLFGLPIKTVVGTSLAIVAMKSIVGFAGGDLIRLAGEIEYDFLFKFSILMCVGVLIGTQLSKKLDASKLKTVFAWFLLALAGFIFINEIVLKI